MGQLRKMKQENKIMENSTKLQQNNHTKIEALGFFLGASFIFGSISLILSALLLIICVLYVSYSVEYQNILEVMKNYYIDNFSQGKCDIWCVRLDFVINSLQWIILGLSIISACKFIANNALLYGISHRKPSFIKCWLIIGAIEALLSLFFWTSELVVLGHKNSSFATLSLAIVCFLMMFFIKYYFWNMVASLHEMLKKENEEGKAWNRFIAYDLHHDVIQIEKAEGRYMRF